MTQTRKGVALTMTEPLQRSKDSGSNPSSGGGAGIGESAVNGMKYDGLGSQRSAGIRPSRCIDAKYLRWVRKYDQTSRRLNS